MANSCLQVLERFMVEFGKMVDVGISTLITHVEQGFPVSSLVNDY